MSKLSRSEITKRARQRKAIMKEECAKVGIVEKSFWVDKELFEIFEQWERDLGGNDGVHAWVNFAVQEFLKAAGQLDKEYQLNADLQVATSKAKVRILRSELADARVKAAEAVKDSTEAHKDQEEVKNA